MAIESVNENGCCSKTSSQIVLDMPGSQGLPGDLPLDILAEEGADLILIALTKCLATKYPLAKTLQEVVAAMETEICLVSVEIAASAATLAAIELQDQKYGLEDAWFLPTPENISPGVATNLDVSAVAGNSLTTTAANGIVTILEAGWYQIYVKVDVTSTNDANISIQTNGEQLDYIQYLANRLGTLNGSHLMYLTAGQSLGFQVISSALITATLAGCTITYVHK